MSEALQAQVKATPATHLLTPVHPGMLQRKCACGSSASASGQCQQCKDKEKPLQRYSNSRTADSLLCSLADSSFAAPSKGPQHNSASTPGHSFGQVKVLNRTPRKLQPKLSISSPTDQHEQEADRAAELITGASPHSAPEPSRLSGALSSTQPLIQRSPADSNASAEVSPSAAAATSEPASQTGAAEQSSPAAFIVDDDAAQLDPAQMRKTQFLDQLQSEVCAAADAELVSVGRSAQGCPYIENWIGYYRSRPSQYVERSLRKYAPEAAAATSAQDYIPLVAQRVRRAVSVWATTGEITGVPDELAGQLPSGGLLGAAEGLLSGIGGAISGAIGSVGSAIASIFTKAKDGGPRQADDPQQIQAQLNDGQTLDGGVRSRMEAAYGHDFSRVRVHTGSRAASLSNDLNARAFTIGSDIAFAGGEYRPGTMVGDALLAHELAHVVQQGGAVSSAGPMHKGATDYNSLEEDADRSAVNAVVSMWGGAKDRPLGLVDGAKASLRSGLRLQRCSRDPKFSTTACAQPVKTISVDLVSLRGASRTPADDLSFANSVFRSCCVQFSQAKDETATTADSDTWLGGDTVLNRSGSCGAASAEETAVYSGAKAKFGLSSRFQVFYVDSVDPGARAFSMPPYCATGAGAGLVNMSVVTNSGRDRSLAHEFGHILLNSEKHTGIDNPSDKDNLMIPTNDATGEVVDATQCATIYGNA